MNYFCTRCRKKHDIADIGINLYDALISDIHDNVRTIFAGISNELEGREREIYALCTNVLKFLFDRQENENDWLYDGRKKVEKVFLFSGSKILEMIEEGEWTDTTVKGRFSLSFDWLLEKYESTGARDEDEQKAADGLKPLALEEIPDSAREKYIYSDILSFSFDKEVKQQGEWLFDHAAYKNGDPFIFEAYAPDGRPFAKMEGYVRVCSHCGKPLPAAVGRAPEIVIALAGARGAGITSCLAAMASDLYKGEFEQYGITCNTASFDYEMEGFNNWVKNQYEKGLTADKPIYSNYDLETYSFEIHFGNRKRVLTMVDMTGRFFGLKNVNPAFFKCYMGIYGAIDFVWFFVSKPAAYQLPLFDLTKSDHCSLQSLYPTPESSPDPNIWRIMDESSDILYWVNAYNPGRLSENLSIIRDGLRYMGKKMPPVLVVMTKSDLITDGSERELLSKKQIFPPHAVDKFNRRNIENILKKDSSGFYIDEKALFMSGSNTRDLFGIRANRFISAIENQFEHRFYTAISSYGHKASGFKPGNALPPTPYNELMPLIWTLAVSGIARIRKDCEWEKKNLFGFRTEPEKGTQDIEFNALDYINRMIPQAESKKASADMEMLWHTAARNLLFKGVQIGNRVRYYSTTFPHKKQKK